MPTKRIIRQPPKKIDSLRASRLAVVRDRKIAGKNKATGKGMGNNRLD
jgi:hypothetical protein